MNIIQHIITRFKYIGKPKFQIPEDEVKFFIQRYYRRYGTYYLDAVVLQTGGKIGLIEIPCMMRPQQADLRKLIMEEYLKIQSEEKSDLEINNMFSKIV